MMFVKCWAKTPRCECVRKGGGAKWRRAERVRDRKHERLR